MAAILELYVCMKVNIKHILLVEAITNKVGDDPREIESVSWF